MTTYYLSNENRLDEIEKAYVHIAKAVDLISWLSEEAEERDDEFIQDYTCNALRAMDDAHDAILEIQAMLESRR